MRCPECGKPCVSFCAGPHPDYDFERAIARGDVDMGRLPVIHRRRPQVYHQEWRVTGIVRPFRRKWRECEICGEGFMTYDPRTRTCSRTCGQRWAWRRKRKVA